MPIVRWLVQSLPDIIFLYLTSPYVLNMDLKCFLFEAPGLELLKNTTSNP